MAEFALLIFLLTFISSNMKFECLTESFEFEFDTCVEDIDANGSPLYTIEAVHPATNDACELIYDADRKSDLKWSEAW